LSGVRYLTARLEDSVVLVIDLSVIKNSSVSTALQPAPGLPATYRIEAGDALGIYSRPEDEGCVRNKKHISTTTRHGNSSTSPRGTDIVEFFFILIRRPKKDVKKEVRIRDGAFLSSFSSEGRSTTDPFGVLENRCERRDMVLLLRWS